tara:strand:+ start:175 stop:303 length:129 start_codon:yes stop_codon:yes gene_type:complete
MSIGGKADLKTNKLLLIIDKELRKLKDKVYKLEQEVKVLKES